MVANLREHPMYVTITEQLTLWCILCSVRCKWNCGIT